MNDCCAPRKIASMPRRSSPDDQSKIRTMEGIDTEFHHAAWETLRRHLKEPFATVFITFPLGSMEYNRPANEQRESARTPHGHRRDRRRCHPRARPVRHDIDDAQPRLQSPAGDMLNEPVIAGDRGRPQ